MNNLYKLLLNLCLISISFSAQTMDIGPPIVPNECSSLANNNPLKLDDCSNFTKKKKNCCLLSVFENKLTEDEDGEQYYEQLTETACVLLEKTDNESVTTARKKYRDILNNSDLSIECYSKKIAFYMGYLLFVLIII